jgi:hypothetical protein
VKRIFPVAGLLAGASLAAAQDGTGDTGGGLGGLLGIGIGLLVLVLLGPVLFRFFFVD